MDERNTSMVVRKLEFMLSPEDVEREELVAHIKDNFLLNFNKNNRSGIIVGNLGMIYTSSGKDRLSLNSGMITLGKRLGLERPPVRLDIAKPHPKQRLREMFPTGYDENKVIVAFGSLFSREAIERSIAGDEIYQRNNFILQNDLLVAVTAGIVPITHLGAVQNGKNIVETLKKENTVLSRPKLDGSIELVFAEYDCVTQKKIDGGRETTVTLIGYPDQTAVKKKHYYIYSLDANYGKTYVTIRDLVDKYSSTVISDLNNACGLVAGTQFLVVDEYEGTNTFPSETIKRITGGNATTCSLNRKSHGSSFQLAPDVQMILLSNFSLYNNYAKYDRAMGRRVLSAELYNHLSARFHVFRLDGDDEDEKCKWVHHSALSRQERFKKINLESRAVSQLIINGLDETFSAGRKVDASLLWNNITPEINKMSRLYAAMKQSFLMSDLFSILPHHPILPIEWSEIVECMFEGNIILTTKHMPEKRRCILDRALEKNIYPYRNIFIPYVPWTTPEEREREEEYTRDYTSNMDYYEDLDADDNGYDSSITLHDEDYTNTSVAFTNRPYHLSTTDTGLKVNDTVCMYRDQRCNSTSSTTS